MLFIISVNPGDVNQYEGRISGCGVNIAARIESSAELGGVSISRTLYSKIHNRLNHSYEHQGCICCKEHHQAVRVYKVLTALEDAATLIDEPRQQPRSFKRPCIS